MPNTYLSWPDGVVRHETQIILDRFLAKADLTAEEQEQVRQASERLAAEVCDVFRRTEERSLPSGVNASAGLPAQPLVDHVLMLTQAIVQLQAVISALHLELLMSKRNQPRKKGHRPTKKGRKRG